MRISDWSSDVCSSDLHGTRQKGCYHPRQAQEYPGSGEGLLWPPQEHHPHRAAGSRKGWPIRLSRSKVKKRSFRALWIQRINAAVRMEGLTYGQFMHGLKLAGVELDRKVLADIAMHEGDAFKAIVAQAQAALPKA